MSRSAGCFFYFCVSCFLTWGKFIKVNKLKSEFHNVFTKIQAAIGDFHEIEPLTIWSLHRFQTSLQVVLAAIKGCGGKPRVSAYTLQNALLQFYTEENLFPPGLFADIPAVQSWALKHAVAIKKLVPSRTTLVIFHGNNK